MQKRNEAIDPETADPPPIRYTRHAAAGTDT